MELSSALPVHFWMPGVDDAFEEWDPDSDPSRYLSGPGHGTLELFKRLEQLGRPVALGPAPERPSHVVFHLESVWRWDLMGPDRALLRQLTIQLGKTGVGTAIRGDVPFQLRVPGVVEVMPNRTSIRRRNQLWVPLLPQRGLVPRAPSRYGSVLSLALLGFEANIPPMFRSASFRQASEAMGITIVDLLRTRETPVPPWHDHSQVDCVLCVRADALGTGLERKPATKLINAWVAGSIPIVDREPAHMELARPEVDCLMVEGPDGVLQALERLRLEDGLVRRLEEGGREQAARFAPERVLAEWEDLLFERPPRRNAAATVAGVAAWFASQSRRLVASARRRVQAVSAGAQS